MGKASRRKKERREWRGQSGSAEPSDTTWTPEPEIGEPSPSRDRPNMYADYLRNTRRDPPKLREPTSPAVAARPVGPAKTLIGHLYATAPMPMGEQLAGSVRGVELALNHQKWLVAQARRSGHTWEEIASRLGITKQAAHQRFRRARDELAEGWAQERAEASGST